MKHYKLSVDKAGHRLVSPDWHTNNYISEKKDYQKIELIEVSELEDILEYLSNYHADNNDIQEIVTYFRAYLSDENRDYSVPKLISKVVAYFGWDGKKAV